MFSPPIYTPYPMRPYFATISLLSYKDTQLTIHPPPPPCLAPGTKSKQICAQISTLSAGGPLSPAQGGRSHLPLPPPPPLPTHTPRSWPGNPTGGDNVLSTQCWDPSKVVRVRIVDSCPCKQVGLGYTHIWPGV